MPHVMHHKEILNVLIIFPIIPGVFTVKSKENNLYFQNTSVKCKLNCLLENFVELLCFFPSDIKVTVAVITYTTPV